MLEEVLATEEFGETSKKWRWFLTKVHHKCRGGGIFLPYCILHEEMKPCLMYCSVFRKYRGEFLHGPPAWDTSPAESI